MFGLFSLFFFCSSGFVGDNAGGGIRNVDFANYTYPWRETKVWPDRLEWQRNSEPNRVGLVKGRWRQPDSEGPARGDFQPPFNGLTLEEVVYGDVTGDHNEDAAAVLRYDTGGTQCHHFVYVYSSGAKGPKLLAWFRTGDRAHNGLAELSVREGKLAIDLYDPDERQGDCCSSGVIRQQYRWNGRVFAKDGEASRGSARRWSRRSVSVFGLPYN